MVAPNWTPRLGGRTKNAIQFNSVNTEGHNSVTTLPTNKKTPFTEEDFNFDNDLIEISDEQVFSMLDEKIYNSEFNQISNENNADIDRFGIF